MISILSNFLVYFICLLSFEDSDKKNYLDNFISLILISVILSLSTVSIISLFFVFANTTSINIAFTSLVALFTLTTIKYRNLDKIKCKRYFLNIKEEFLLLINNFKKLDYLIIFITLLIYILSFGPINHSDASTAYVGYIKQFWLRNSHFIDGSVHQGLLGVSDFVNLAFFQEGNTWLIRSIQVLPLFPSVIYLLKNKINKLFLLSFLFSPNFIQWVTIGKNLFCYDLILAILYLVWCSNKSNRNLVYLISILMINFASKITGILIIIPILFHLIFYYRKHVIDLKNIFTSKLLILVICISLSTLFLSYCYSYHVTGNPIYPLFSEFFTPDNQLFIDFEADIKNYMRGLLFPIKMILPFGITNIGIVLGPALGLSIIISLLNSYKINRIYPNSKFIIGFSQLIMLLLFCQGRANYYTCPIILIFSSINFSSYKLFSISMNKKINLFFRNIFFTSLIIQIIISLIIFSASFYQTSYAIFNYDKAMSKFAYNYDFSKIINQNIREPYLNLFTIQDRLFSNSKYIDSYTFSQCLKDNYMNKENELKFCLQKYKVQSIVLRNDGLFATNSKKYSFLTNDFKCNDFKVFMGNRNIFNSRNKEIMICNSTKKDQY